MRNISALLFIKQNSERIPGKNFRPFGGQPLFTIILQTLHSTNLFNKIIVDSDSDIVLNYVSENLKNGYAVTRPENLKGNTISANDLINYDMNFADTEHLFQTHCTNPLLTAHTIKKATELYFHSLKNHDSVFSVSRIQNRVYTSDGKPVNHNSNELKRTQDLPPLFAENPSFFIFSKSSFKHAGNNRIGMRPLMFEISPVEGIDIDYENEFRLAEIVAGNKHMFPDVFHNK